MNSLKNINTSLKIYLTIFLIISILQDNEAQTDSLQLNNVITQVLANYPSVKQVEEALNAADIKISMAKSAYLPNVSFDATYTYLYPITEITFGGKSFQMNTDHNYNTGLIVTQTIYDFGRTSKNIELENQSKALTQISLEQAKQKLSTGTINCFYALVFLQEAIEIKNEQLQNLNKHLEFVQKKNETGSAIQYEILTTKVRISSIESQKTELEAAHTIQLAVLNTLLGKPERNNVLVKKETGTNIIDIDKDSLISFAYSHRNEIKAMEQKNSLAQLKYNLTQTQYYPVISFFGNGGIKNGYPTDFQEPTFNFAVGVSLKVPIFQGFRTKYQSSLNKSEIQNVTYETDLTRKNIANEVIESSANVNSAMRKISQNEMQLQQARQALKLAETNYSLGVITNLELIDATTSVSESRLALLKSEIDYTVNLYKLKAAIGEKLY